MVVGLRTMLRPAARSKIEVHPGERVERWSIGDMSQPLIDGNTEAFLAPPDDVTRQKGFYSFLE